MPDRKKKTLIHLLPINRWSAVGKYALDICRHYHSVGIDTFVLTRGAVVVDRNFSDFGIPFVNAPLSGLTSFSTALALRGELERRADKEVVVHIHRYRDAFAVRLAAFLAKHPAVRIVSTRHKVRVGRTGMFYPRLYRCVDSHVFVSALARDAFLKPWVIKGRLPFDADSIHVLHNSVLAAPESPLPEPERGAITALFHGNISRGKGVETLIDALSLIKGVKVRLKIAGAGTPDYIDTLRVRAELRGVTSLIDWNNGGELFPLIAQCHFGVLPSLEREACGLSNIELMACGRAQICSANGAQGEYLSDGLDALFSPPADTVALAAKIKRLASNSDLRHRMGSNAFSAYRDHLSWSVFIKALDKIYNFPSTNPRF